MDATILITGGAGFTGVNTAKAFLDRGWRVVIYDNFLRRGSRQNIEWLASECRGKVRVVEGTLLEFEKLRDEIGKVDAIIHLAAQVAVTTSVQNPRLDFETNALGSFNVAEAIRQAERSPVVIYTSTNKVYGGLEKLRITEGEERYVYDCLPNGIDESTPLDFHSPYGCSKGCADQYFRDYYRMYGVRSIVFRQSCVYGAHQFGNENQGWAAHFAISSVLGLPLRIYGNGKQVRDLLFMNDLCDLYVTVIENPDAMLGRIYNIGGGASNAKSVLELVHILEEILDRKLEITFGPWRPGDQRIYISDISAIARDCGWQPKTSPKAGIEKLVAWAQGSMALLKEIGN
jgi:CDP-paratose 2-epimerase